MHIRDATRDDFSSMIEILEEMALDNAQFSINRQKSLSLIANMIDDPNSWIFLCIDDDVIAGMFAVSKTSPWYSDDPILDEGWVYVRRSHRKTRAVFYLCKEVQQLSSLLGDLPVMVDVVTANRANIKVKLFNRYFKNVGEKNVFRK